MAGPHKAMTGTEKPPADGFLMRFADGPMSKRQNIPTLAGTSGNTVIGKEVFGWPLPERLGVLCHEGVEQVAFWDADDPAGSELPTVITESANASVYRKIGESQLGQDVPGVLRGAHYALEQG